jgi:hypothetical protein
MNSADFSVKESVNPNTGSLLPVLRAAVDELDERRAALRG